MDLNNENQEVIMQESHVENIKPKGKGKNKAKSQLIAIILVGILALGAGFGGGLAANYYVNGSIGPHVSKTTSPSIIISMDEDPTIAEAIAVKVLPSVVGISTVTEHSYGSYFGFNFGFGEGDTYDAQSIGTGVIVDESGYILTNSHVVNDGDTKSITVSLYDGTDVKGTVLWSDPILDLAVVKVETVGLHAAELGDSDLMNIGAYTAAIGNPLGLDFERSMSQGIISGLNRSIQVGNENSVTTMEGLMQTDATINSGNSGGPLLNKNGQVIGINTAKAESGEGMGFAIPINVAKPIVEEIMATGTFTRAYIGISGVGLEEQKYYSAEDLISQFGTAKGIYVAELLKGGGAEKGGIKKGDIITALEGKSVGTMNKINTILVSYRPGDTVELTILRDKESKTFSVTLTDGNTEI